MGGYVFGGRGSDTLGRFNADSTVSRRLKQFSDRAGSTARTISYTAECETMSINAD